uniref:Condensin-2 complex subunit D3 n=1 Tax=Salmo trutta TaxID=8032 RepID=A0A673XFC8_SALTR
MFFCAGWVDAVWDFEFTETEPLDAAIVIKNGSKEFKTLYSLLLPYMTDTESVWTVFGDNGVSVKSLVAVLSYFILGGKSKTASVQQRISALQASSLYLLLLGIPGSVVNKMFHQILFDTCLNTVSNCWPQSLVKKRKKDTLKSSQADGKRSKPHRKDNDEMEVDEDEEQEEEVHLSPQDLLKIREGVVLLVKSLLRLLLKFPLKDEPQSADNCMFAKLTNFEPVIGELTFGAGQDIDDMRTMPELAYYGLWLLCSSNHGDEKSLRRVFHRVLYVILMMSKGESGKPSLMMATQAVLAARDQAIGFVSHVVDELKEPALPFLRILLQHISFRMVDKTDYRTHGAQAVAKLLAKMPCGDYASFIKWLFDYSRQVAYRMFALDVSMALLEQPEREANENLDAELVSFLSHRFLVHNMVFGRRSDASPTVRGHALTCLAQCLDLPSMNATRSIKELFPTSESLSHTYIYICTLNSQTTQKTFRTLPFKTIEITNNDHASFELFDGNVMLMFSLAKDTMALLKHRVSDPKTNVRKCALQAMMGLLKHNVIMLSEENLAVLSERTRDPALSVKKKALQCLMDLLAAHPENSLVQKAWLRGVVPAVVDAESSVQEKALECLEQTILSQVKSHGSYSYRDAQQTLTWDLLGLLCDNCQDLGRYFSRAFTVWSKQNKFTAAFINNLISHTEAEHATGAWLLLSKVASSCPRLDYGKILDAWDDLVRSNVTVTTSCHILCVIGDIGEHLNEDTKSRIVEDIITWLKSFDMPLEVISASVETLCRLGKAEAVSDTQTFLNQHCGELVSLCEAYLSSVILNENGAQNLNEDLVVKHLYTLGVASLHCPSKVGKRIVLLVQSVLTSSELAGSQPLSQFKASSMPSSVRAHAVITLGKLCLQHEELTRKYLPAFARELELCSELAVRSNVVVVMCDLCVRYTNMVDRYVPNVSACLRDKEPLIRKQTLTMLTNLLQEEYVKWKGSLFFRFIAVLVDSDPTIASLCEYCLVHLLLKKNPVMFSQHFIECIFHFNSYEKHKTYNNFPQTASEKAKFSLKGAQNKERRFTIYRFLLVHFTDAQRFNITIKISQNILACFVDGELPLDGDGAAVLAETFGILSLKEIKLSALSGAAGAGGDEPQEDEQMAMAKAVMQVAQKKVVSQVQKKVFIESMIPIIINLKSMLEQKRSPVLKDLMGYLQLTMQDYRSEVKEFFAADEQLAVELEYNLKMYEKEKEQEMEAQMAHCSLGGDAASGGTPVSTRPSNGGRSFLCWPVQLRKRRHRQPRNHA